MGHMRAAEYAIRALALDKLLVIPSKISPHKVLPKDSPTPAQRLEMLQIATAGLDKMVVSDLELNREGTSYTYQTVQQVRRMYPRAKIYLLMGTDMFLSFHTWRNPELITKDAALGVFYRGENGEVDAINARKAECDWEVELIENPVIDISSTQLRRMLVFGCADSFLPQGVGEYIRSHGFYGTDESYVNLSMEELEQTVVSLLNPNRVAHVLGCRDTAAELARIWGADEIDAARAGLLHDITKALDGPLQLTLCDAYDTMLDKFGKDHPKTLHALTGSLVAQRIFGENPAVVSAIASHTTGKAGMNTLEKIIYVADYMEPNRNFPGVEKLRHLAEIDLDAAMKLGLEMTLEHLARQGSTVSPESLEALAYFN
jgi:nicotinate-nucleotide adenylyltransferase